MIRRGMLGSAPIATTRALSGAFSARRVAAGAHGTYVAFSKPSGETCTVHAII